MTSADSTSLVLGPLTSGGALRPHRVLVVLRGVLIGAVAAALLLAGGLAALRQATIMVALPLVVVMLGLAVALLCDMVRDPAANPQLARGRRLGPAAAVLAARSYDGKDPPPVTRWLHRRPRRPGAFATRPSPALRIAAAAGQDVGPRGWH